MRSSISSLISILPSRPSSMNSPESDRSKKHLSTILPSPPSSSFSQRESLPSTLKLRLRSSTHRVSVIRTSMSSSSSSSGSSSSDSSRSSTTPIPSARLSTCSSSPTVTVKSSEKLSFAKTPSRKSRSWSKKTLSLHSLWSYPQRLVEHRHAHSHSNDHLLRSSSSLTGMSFWCRGDHDEDEKDIIEGERGETPSFTNSNVDHHQTTSNPVNNDSDDHHRSSSITTTTADDDHRSVRTRPASSHHSRFLQNHQPSSVTPPPLPPPPPPPPPSSSPTPPPIMIITDHQPSDPKQRPI